MTHDPGPAFRALHQPGAPFILANAWDRGSAQMLAAMGAQAIGTTSAGHAFTLGRADMGTVSRDEALAHAQDLVAATPLPVSGDFENGFGEAPDKVAETIRLAAEVGLAGCSVEDMALPEIRAYPFELALERVQAAVAAARALPKDFVFVARADGVMNGVYDFDEGLRRAIAFALAGADCVYIPIPPSLEDIRTLCAAVDCPVNALAAGSYIKVSQSDFAAAGVARISLGSALARVTHKVISQAATAMFGEGDFSGLRGMPGPAVDDLLEKGACTKG